MSETKNTKNKKSDPSLIDPIYQKFTKSIIRAIGSTEFYEFFMDAVSKADNEFQFSNRKLEKAVDLNWVDQIESALPAMQNIIGNPRNVIKEDEIIVNASIAKKTNSDVVRHLTSHAAYVEDYDERTGDVRPQRLMQKVREDTEVLYENRLVFTTLEMAYHFVKIRHDALFEAMGDEFGAKLKVQSDMQSMTESVHVDMFVHIKETESVIDTDERNAEVFGRISKIYRLLAVFMNTAFAKQMEKVPRAKGNIVKTNVLKKNPNYRKVAQLLEFLRSYDNIGYSIRVIEQSPKINEVFERDIYHNILFNYMILKGYLQDESDRILPVKPKEKQRALKPKFIKEIIEELTEDYDLPDVEIRKVLIEELTKEQLMAEEAAERRRLVEEQAQRKKEEEERIKREKEAERERIKQEKEAEKERIRQEKEAEKQRLFHERMMREAEDRRRGDIFRKELKHFEKHLKEQMEARDKHLAKYLAEKEDFADAAQIIEAVEQRKIEAAERKKKLKQEEKERILQEERERKEKLRLQLEQEKQRELERQAQLEREAKEALERQLAEEKELLRVYYDEFKVFESNLSLRKRERIEYENELKAQAEQREAERRQRFAMRNNQQ